MQVRMTLMKINVVYRCGSNSVGQGWGGCREGPVRPSQLRAGAPPASKKVFSLIFYKKSSNIPLTESKIFSIIVRVLSDYG